VVPDHAVLVEPDGPVRLVQEPPVGVGSDDGGGVPRGCQGAGRPCLRPELLRLDTVTYARKQEGDGGFAGPTRTGCRQAGSEENGRTRPLRLTFEQDEAPRYADGAVARAVCVPGRLPGNRRGVKAASSG